MTGKRKSYSVQELAKLSGVSVRTLHYYDELHLLQPTRKENNYRVYGPAEVDRLQQILLYREAGMNLTVIRDILDNPSFDVEAALADHLETLQSQRKRLDALIKSVEKTLTYKKEERPMSDKEKFESFKKELVEENEKKYGAEVREAYGNETVDASNAKVMGMSEDQYEKSQALEAEMKESLLRGIESGDPAGIDAQKAADLHKQWLSMFWKDGMYSKEAHLGLAEGYVADERFTAYYDAIAPGATVFLRDAIKAYCA